jgi:hypothetical protein
VFVRPTAEVLAFLNMRFSTDTTSTANVIAQILPGTQMELLQTGDEGKIGVNGQFIRVREPKGNEGYVAAWSVERVAVAPPPAPAPTPATTPPAPSATPPTGTPPPVPSTELKVKVKSAGTKVYSYATARSPVVNTEQAGAVLTVIEAASVAKPKVGMNGKWLNVQASNGRRGFIQGQTVSLA